MTERLTVQILAKELTQHVQDCTSQRQETAEALRLLNGRLAFVDTVNHWVGLLSKHGKKFASLVLVAVIGAWATVLTQNYLLHRATEQTAAATTVAANTTTISQKELIKKVDQLIQDTPPSAGAR